jgi:hypothetical protein
MLSRRLTFLVVSSLALALALAACGGSSQVKAARAARYKADATVIFAAVVDATGEKYKVERADAPSGTLVTVARWYEYDGHLEDMDASGERAMLEDNDYLVGFLVQVVGANGEFQVQVTPRVAQMRSGYAKPVDLKPDDLAMPGWVIGRTDDLYVKIYEKLKAYEVKPGA